MKDGAIYGTIRNGTQIMPPYGDALTPMERWRVVRVRILASAPLEAWYIPAKGGESNKLKQAVISIDLMYSHTPRDARNNN